MDVDPLNAVPRVDAAERRVGPDPDPHGLEVAFAWLGAHYGRTLAGLVLLLLLLTAAWLFGSIIDTLLHALYGAMGLGVLCIIVFDVVAGGILLMHRSFRRRRGKRFEREAAALAGRLDADRVPARHAYRPLIEATYPGAGRTLEAAALLLLMLPAALGTLVSLSLLGALLGGAALAAIGALLLTLGAVALDIYLGRRLVRALREHRVFLATALEAARRAAQATSGGTSLRATDSARPTFRPYGSTP